jgi:predicted nucleic acid-binding protein
VGVFLSYPVQLANPKNLYQEAFTFAHSRGLLSIYDALYVVLARMLNAEIWTADQRLLVALVPRHSSSAAAEPVG